MAYEKTYFRERRDTDRFRRGDVSGLLLSHQIHHYRVGGHAGAGRRLVNEMLMGGEL